MVLILTEEQLIQLGKASKEQFKGSADYYEFLMFEIQGHIVERLSFHHSLSGGRTNLEKKLFDINDLKEKKDPHAKNEMVDLAILSKMLALNEGADKRTYSERFKKFKEKIND